MPTFTPYPTGTAQPAPYWVPTLTAQAFNAQATNEALGTVYPTGTPAPTGTPVPGVTGTPVPGVTGTPRPDFLVSYDYTITNPQFASVSDFACVTNDLTAHCDYTLNWNDTSPTVDPIVYIQLQFTEPFYYSMTYDAVIGVGFGSGDVRFNNYFEGKYLFSGHSFGHYAGGVYSHVYTVHYDFSRDPYGYLTPSPTPGITPTPGALSYCGVVDDTSDTSSFALPVITGGDPVCGGAGGFVLPFSWLQMILPNSIFVDDLIVPYLEVCFIPTSFGELVLAGNVINLDIVAAVLGALFLFSLVR